MTGDKESCDLEAKTSVTGRDKVSKLVLVGIASAGLEETAELKTVVVIVEGNVTLMMD